MKPQSEWEKIHDDGYRYRHLYSRDILMQAVKSYLKHYRPMRIVVIGAGDGRECAWFAPLGEVYAIDVRPMPIEGCISVAASEFENKVPEKIDLVVSMTTIQHMTKEWTRHYVDVLSKRLAPGGVMVLQFAEYKEPPTDGPEPIFSWSMADIIQLVQDYGLRLRRIHHHVMKHNVKWHVATIEANPAIV